MKLNVQFTDRTMRRFDNIRVLDAIDEKAAFQVFHVEPKKIQPEILKSQEIRGFSFNKVGALCDIAEEWYYIASEEDNKNTIEYLQSKLEDIEKYKEPFDIIIPPKTWWGYKNEDEIEKYAKKVGGHIANVVEWAMWVTQRLQEGETLLQLNKKWISRDWQWLIKSEDGSYIGIGGSVIDFYFGSEFHGNLPHCNVRNFRCAVSLIVVRENKIPKASDVKKSLTIEITYTNGKKGKIHNVTKYILEERKITLHDFDLTFLPYASEIISVNPGNIKFEMFDNLFTIDDDEELKVMDELSKAVELVRKCPNATFSKPFKLIIPDRMHNTEDVPAMMDLELRCRQEVNDVKGIAGRIHLMVWCAELISKGKNWREVVNLKINSKWSRLFYADQYGYCEHGVEGTLGNIGIRYDCSSKEAYRNSEILNFLFSGEDKPNYKVLNGTLKNVFPDKNNVVNVHDTFDMVPIFIG